jgi:small redox-active disulfide protein 2
LFVIVRTIFNFEIKMNIKVLGTGCPKCKTLEKTTHDAVAEMGISASIEKVDDIVKIMNYGIMNTPALVIDEKVVLSGRVPSLSEIKDLLSKNK